MVGWLNYSHVTIGTDNQLVKCNIHIALLKFTLNEALSFSRMECKLLTEKVLASPCVSTEIRYM